MRLKLFITNQGKILPNIQHVDCINVEKFLHAGYVANGIIDAVFLWDFNYLWYLSTISNVNRQ